MGIRMNDLPFPFPTDGFVSPSDPAVRSAIYLAHKGIDFWTRAPLTFDDMVLDHVWPKSKGGPDHVFNLVPTEDPLNNAKRAKLDIIAATAVLAILRSHHGPEALCRLNRRVSFSFLRKGARNYGFWMEANRELFQADLERIGWVNPWGYLSSYFEEQRFVLNLNKDIHRRHPIDSPSVLEIRQIARAIGIRPPVYDKG